MLIKAGKADQKQIYRRKNRIIPTFYPQYSHDLYLLALGRIVKISERFLEKKVTSNCLNVSSKIYAFDEETLIGSAAR